MTLFVHSEDGVAFIASAAVRQTSPEVMKAFAWLARDEADAEQLWEGTGFSGVLTLFDVVEAATTKPRRKATNLLWNGRTLQQAIDSGEFPW